MALTAELIRELTALGLVGEKLIACVTLFERYASQTERDGRDAKSKSAERSRRYRQRQRDGIVTEKRDGSKKANLSSSSFLLTNSPRKPREVSKKERIKKKDQIPVPDDWGPKDSHFRWAEKNNRPASYVLAKADRVRDWSKSKDERRADWDAVLFVFMRDDGKKGAMNGNRNSYQNGNGRGSGTDVFSAMAEYKASNGSGTEPRYAPSRQPLLELSARDLDKTENIRAK